MRRKSTTARLLAEMLIFEVGELRRDRVAGVSPRALARKYGISVGSVYNYLRELPKGETEGGKYPAERSLNALPHVAVCVEKLARIDEIAVVENVREVEKQGVRPVSAHSADFLIKKEGERDSVPKRSLNALARVGAPVKIDKIEVVKRSEKQVVAAGWMSWRGDWWQWSALALPLLWLGNSAADWLLVAFK